jgi:ribose transport system substrate-binding protein
MRKLISGVCALCACLVLVTACGDSDDSSSGGGGGGGETAAPSDVVAKAQKGLDELGTTVLSTGPNGEKPSAAGDLSLSPEELQQIKMGIRVISVTDANFKPEKQVSDIETVLAKKPDIIISIPTDPVATAAAYRKAERQGVKLVFMDNVPKDFAPGKDYVSVVSADNYGNGVASAHLMAEQLKGKGKIGIIFHEADFFVTKQRYDAFKKTIAEQYPDIEVVAEQGIAGPDFAGDAEKVASAMLTKNADLDGIWAVWDVPAEGVLAAARANGRNDLAVTTIDLGQNVAIDMAKGGPIKGLGAQRPFDQGVAEATLAGYGLLDKEAPPYVAVNALPVRPANLAEAWQTVYHQGLPPKVEKAAK